LLHKPQGDTLTATLRLIRIFAKHGTQLESTFKQGFLETPLEPWKNVIPQLFSRLYHPERFVRDELTVLLCRIAEGSPNLIIHAAVIGSSEAKNENTSIRKSYTSIIDILNAKNPSLVLELTKWIHELQRITVLWEEIWQLGLERINLEVNARIAKLQKDLVRINENATLSEFEKNEIKKKIVSSLLKPILFSIDEMFERTFRLDVETPHEKKFVDAFEGKIDDAYKVLQTVDSLESLKKGWKEFNIVYFLLILDFAAVDYGRKFFSFQSIKIE
jgi:hypothetical protein